MEQQTTVAGFWDTPDQAQTVMAEIARLKATVTPYEKAVSQMDDLEALAELLSEEEDSGEEETLAEELHACTREIDALEMQTFLSGPHDAANAILEVNAGAGGTESCDWAGMLLRMYMRWAERHGMDVEMLNEVEGEVAGMKNATIMVKGPFAYGHLRVERGVHRLVRISPFDSNARRHTSFASVDVVPEIDEDLDVEINPDDLRIDTYRSSGAGGQHVNKTSSAVRITHIPTGIVVSCQNERSQHQNRDVAMRVLRAKLWEIKRQEEEAKIDAIRGEQRDIAWGNQIRSYVFQPYQMVKDHRTHAETSNVEASGRRRRDRWRAIHRRGRAN